MWDMILAILAELRQLQATVKSFVEKSEAVSEAAASVPIEQPRPQRK